MHNPWITEGAALPVLSVGIEDAPKILGGVSRTRIFQAVIPFPRPRIERDGEGWLVLRGSHGSLCGDRRQALREFAELERIERRGSA